MEQTNEKLMLSLIRSAMGGEPLSVTERETCAEENISEAMKLAVSHDLGQIVAWGLKKNEIKNAEAETVVFKSVYRYQQIKYEYERLCNTLESAAIPFMPLKGSVIRKYYPEAWMRTSCDIDILVHTSDLDRACNILKDELKYKEDVAHSHDVAFFSPTGVHVELHFDLIEESLMNASAKVLKNVWSTATVKDGYTHFYEMTDELFYFYHVAHMAKHLLNGGCGIKPFIDLMILDGMDGADRVKRDALLNKGELLKFTETARRVCDVWFGSSEHDSLTKQMEKYVLAGGVYGNDGDNRLSIQLHKSGGRSKYLISLIFLPYESIKYMYPILQKHRWLTPIMQVRRWFRIIFGGRIGRAASTIAKNRDVSDGQVQEVRRFLGEVGLL